MATTHFGYKDVAEEEKASLVGEVFAGVANRYDIMNDLMSGGLHRLWKNQLLSMLSPRPDSSLLDVAGGTGDIAKRFLDRAPQGHVMVCDINPAMLGEGKDRFIDLGLHQNATFLCGNAEALPLEDMSVDYYTIAFGIRNVTRIQKALEEAHRVLRPGGRFLCLEFTPNQSAWLQKAYDLYSFHFIPKIGAMVTGNEEAYQYLVESIRMFPEQEIFKSMIEEAGFINVSYRNLTGGIVAIHSGWKS